MKKILINTYTEYQLLLALNEIFVNKTYPIQEFEITILIKIESLHKRMEREFNFDSLGVKIVYFKDDFSMSDKLSSASKLLINEILSIDWDTFILFQENDFLNTMLSYNLDKKGTVVRLYQDGLKAYNPLKSRSYGQLKIELKVRLFWFKNGYSCDPMLNALNAYKYGFLKGVKNIHVTFPEAYNNWNNKNVVKINIEKSNTLFELMKEVFVLHNYILNQTKDVIFFVSQSMRDDNSFERQLIEYLIAKFDNKKIYLKSHPILFKPYRDFIEELKSKYSNRIEVIDDKLPAEFLIMQLEDSIVISTISTSMFLNNPTCRFYYTFELAKNQINRFNRYETINPTKHVMSVNSFEEIK